MLYTNEILQYLVLILIVNALTAKNILLSLCLCVSVMNSRICDVLLNFVVSVYIIHIMHVFCVREISPI